MKVLGKLKGKKEKRTHRDSGQKSPRPVPPHQRETSSAFQQDRCDNRCDKQ
jgi:hypothetical protein